MSDYLDPNNEELLKDFFVEAQMSVDLLEQNILILENDPTNKESIDEIFRAAHTLKGAAATVQMDELAGFTHIVEDVLDEIRSGNIQTTSEIVDILLNSIDIIKEMLAARTDGNIYSEDISETTDVLVSYLPGKEHAAAGKAKKSSKKEEAPKSSKKASKKKSTKQLSEYELLEMKETVKNGEKIIHIEVHFDEDNPMNTVGGIQVFASLKTVGQVLKTEPDFERLYEDTYYPVVHYYISSSMAPDEIENEIFIPDVTTTVNAFDVDKGPSTDDVEEDLNIPEPPQVKQTTEAAKPPTAQKKEEETHSVQQDLEEAKEQQKKKVREPEKKSSAGSILRVDSRRIDNLLNLVSEAVINKATFNQIGNNFAENLVLLQNSENAIREKVKTLFDSIPDLLENLQNDGSTMKEIRRKLNEEYGDLTTVFDSFESSFKNTVTKFRSTSQHLGRITGDLQEGVMRIRMVPISQIFSRFPRLVRDLSKSLMKKINLVIEGEETELDKSVIEDLLDPLIHCVRNSIDHGLEDPSVRLENGKPEEGTVLLKASNEGNMIVIEISDDGKGIDVDTVRQKAIDRGIIHPNKALSDIEAFNLIFEPGFSTAQAVTNISGRGVGLDVVRKQIEKLNGTVTVWSEKGVGTKFTIKLPLTLAIIQGLLVRVGSEKYAIPITSVVDSHRIKPEEIRSIDNYEVFNVREDVVSLLRLNRLFKIPTDEQKEYYFVVIVGNGDNKMGLIVDSLIGEEDVVIKPLRDQYTNSPGIAGANITGDGTVSLIIDVPQLLELGLRKEQEERRRREATIA